ncbi:type II toxin-antitoxin system HicB family antitoxin [Yersinia enterocolitica]|uniref:type II toxin-antitoxin system HicB family antitoxin n=1 Tax=Yersinia enterocolitica TaxID=630 RepID=UPI0030D26FF4|nr:type II toxin-antitoxin system HicB family antitoxin [Yersinia enterocolitica]
MIYPIFIFSTVEGFDGYFPDIDGCFFAGNTFAEISQHAEEAFATHIEALMDEGFPLPTPAKDPQRYINDPRLKEDGGILGFVEIDPAKYESKAIKFNLTMSQNLLTAIDKFIATHRGYKNRSQFLAELARERIAR